LAAVSLLLPLQSSAQKAGRSSSHSSTLRCHPYKRRCQMRYRVLIAVVGSLVTLATVANAQQVAALLTGYEESPSVSTTATGAFSATIAEDGDVIQYTETFSGLQAPITQSHIHIAQAG